MRSHEREAEVNGHAVLETRGAWTAEAHHRNVDPATLPWWHLPANTPHGKLAGTARVRAVRAKPYPVASVSLALERGSLGRLEIQRGSVQMRLGQPGEVAIETASVDTARAPLL